MRNIYEKYFSYLRLYLTILIFATLYLVVTSYFNYNYFSQLRLFLITMKTIMRNKIMLLDHIIIMRNKITLYNLVIATLYRK